MERFSCKNMHLDLWNDIWKVTRVTGHLIQILDIRDDAANRWQHSKKGRKHNIHNSKLFKTKRVLSESWAELSPAHRGKRWRQKARRGRWQRRRRGLCGGGWEGGVQVRRGKNLRHKESRQRQGTKQTVQLRTSKIHNPQRNHDMTRLWHSLLTSPDSSPLFLPVAPC